MQTKTRLKERVEGGGAERPQGGGVHDGLNLSFDPSPKSFWRGRGPQKRILRDLLKLQHNIEARIYPMHYARFQQLIAERALFHVPFETALFFIVIIYVFQNGAMKLGREHHHSGVEELITITRQAPIAIVFLRRIVN